ncbi:endonuclease domain-containing protein [Pseudonocardia endophytica]|uniref:endonuclease domain-containing protein n=1 Tax=Pseudonocardia endophytica TaxID=401976 RepID=UPI00140502BA|nr:DUF559 domain-containing protein [Pseudonocardia endophytica]
MSVTSKGMDISRRPFVGSEAIAAGAVTPAVLKGPGYRSPFRGIAVAADVPDSFALRSEAAFLVVRGTGALAGYSAAEMLGADCAPASAPAEVVLPERQRRTRAGLIVHRDAVPEAEIVRDVPVRVRDRRGRWRPLPGRTVDTTSPVRTAFDLARREPRIEAVVALDALACHCRISPADVLALAERHPGVRGLSRLPGLVALADGRAESPMETRIRLALLDGGLPCTELQFPLGRYRLDLAYPAAMLAVEYDGEHHREPAQARYDLERQAHIARRGWTVLRPSAHEVLADPEAVADRVRHALASRRPGC